MSFPTYSSYEELLSAIDAGDSGREILNPATGERIGFADTDSVEDLNAAVTRAREAFASFATTTHEQRSAMLNAAADAIEANAEPLAQLLSREQGKPLNGPNARFEVGACSSWLRATASFELEPEVIVDDGETYSTMTYRPLGVVGAIGPWNWPMMITVWQVAPALRMGNTVVVKPSEYTPLSVKALVHLIATAVPEGVLNYVSGDRELGAALSKHPDVDKLMFTGSTSTGQKIIEASAPTYKRLTLELGGNDAGIVLDDVDPAAIAEGLFWGAFINTGQTCAALKRLYVPESIYDEVVNALAEFAKNVPMGEGLDENNVLGPLQNKAQYDIVADLVQKAKDSGARVVIGGDPEEGQKGYFYPTTLVADIDPDNALVVEEQFGPALPIVRYSTVDEAIDLANSLDVGLGSSVWSADRERALSVAERLRAGTTWINNHGAVDPRIPFGGSGHSGYGVEFGIEGLKGLGQPHVITG
ncbi:Phenylacetaldehyde dehydrogenase [Corynebacterium capitovis DSM 44611]|uniref:aldehyde dehydrogenase family protein n=1 Tax=Corynebacterium capitovis TaxID=131081 RepID=UPI00037A02A7|nr:aldehyde dehydrogenase family protein [Corynebacterium capitovis]WKD57976.1 Phenylacetaldehyde dehydrogenase [Corynebacterium capitovis DSM 44611]